MSQALLHAWRHPRPEGAGGLCVGARTDLPVDRRRAKRLAHRIRQQARRERLPRVVATSPLQRCAAVGRWLRRWGWEHRIDADLIELDFGEWDGQPWASVSRDAVDAWCANFAHHAPGGGETLDHLLHRAAAWRASGAYCVVTHGGWMLARAWMQQRPGERPTASQWPAAPAYGSRMAWPLV
ncbi:histidine phosphatase family protein [Ideonella sp. DXS29W]|uniref:Histidine phosphatase family protein n=1 Tax=Ideonella lacteola TaxID=2984193 RepID=A0ABU9BM36_9BURK